MKEYGSYHYTGFQSDCSEDIERVWKEGDLSFVDEYYDDYVLHVTYQSEEIRGPDGYKSYVEAFRTAFPTWTSSTTN